MGRVEETVDHDNAIRNGQHVKVWNYEMIQAKAVHTLNMTERLLCSDCLAGMYGWKQNSEGTFCHGKNE